MVKNEFQAVNWWNDEKYNFNRKKTKKKGNFKTDFKTRLGALDQKNMHIWSFIQDFNRGKKSSFGRKIYLGI